MENQINNPPHDKDREHGVKSVLDNKGKKTGDYDDSVNALLNQSTMKNTFIDFQIFMANYFFSLKPVKVSIYRTMIAIVPI